MAFETEYISRPNLGTSADVPDVPSHTSMPESLVWLPKLPIKNTASLDILSQ